MAVLARAALERMEDDGTLGESRRHWAERDRRIGVLMEWYGNAVRRTQGADPQDLFSLVNFGVIRDPEKTAPPTPQPPEHDALGAVAWTPALSTSTFSPDSEFTLGLTAFEEGDLESARTWWTRAAAHDHSEAMHTLGALADKEGDRATARTWWTRAAAHDHPEAMFILGLLANEDGDRATARTWWTRAAAHDHPQAMNGLAVLAHKEGDLESARTWWTRAAAHGAPRSEEALKALQAMELSKPAPKPSGGCFVATAVYGTYDCPEVWVLRRYRDLALAQSAPGRLFVRAYYTLSPLVLRLLGRRGGVLFRRPTEALVRALEARGYSNAPYADPRNAEVHLSS